MDARDRVWQENVKFGQNFSPFKNFSNKTLLLKWLELINFELIFD